MKEVIKLLDRTLSENIQLDLVAEVEAYLIDADPSRIQQMVMNLAINARDAMPEGGQLQLSLAHLETKQPCRFSLQTMPPGRWIELQVSDNGSGIPPLVLGRIFEPFFTTKEAGQGTGLGLAQVYGIVKQHEGYIDVKTRVDKGTTFSLYFPVLVTDERPTLVLDEVSLQWGQGQRVLVVEDNVDTRQAVVGSLLFLNYEVVEAKNGREALALLATSDHGIALVLSDVVMPEMGGVALLHALRQRDLSVPVVLLTGHPLSKEMDNLRALGLGGWLAKPPNLVDLSTLLAQVLGG